MATTPIKRAFPVLVRLENGAMGVKYYDYDTGAEVINLNGYLLVDEDGLPAEKPAPSDKSDDKKVEINPASGGSTGQQSSPPDKIGRGSDRASYLTDRDQSVARQVIEAATKASESVKPKSSARVEEDEPAGEAGAVPEEPSFEEAPSKSKEKGVEYDEEGNVTVEHVGQPGKNSVFTKLDTKPANDMLREWSTPVADQPKNSLKETAQGRELANQKELSDAKDFDLGPGAVSEERGNIQARELGMNVGSTGLYTAAQRNIETGQAMNYARQAGPSWGSVPAANMQAAIERQTSAVRPTGPEVGGMPAARPDLPGITAPGTAPLGQAVQPAQRPDLPGITAPQGSPNMARQPSAAPAATTPTPSLGGGSQGLRTGLFGEAAVAAADRPSTASSVISNATSSARAVNPGHTIATGKELADMSPARAHSLGLTARTQEEYDKIGHMIAGEMTPGQLANLTSPNAAARAAARTELANINVTVDNRLGQKPWGTMDTVLDASQYNSLSTKSLKPGKPPPIEATNANWAKYAPAIKEAMKEYRTGTLKPTDYTYNHYYSYTMDDTPPGWAASVRDPSVNGFTRVGQHNFGTLTRKQTEEYQGFLDRAQKEGPRGWTPTLGGTPSRFSSMGIGSDYAAEAAARSESVRDRAGRGTFGTSSSPGVGRSSISTGNPSHSSERERDTSLSGRSSSGSGSSAYSGRSGSGSFGTSSSPGVGRSSIGGSGNSSGSGSSGSRSGSSSGAGPGRGSSSGGGIGSSAGAGPGRGSSPGGRSVGGTSSGSSGNNSGTSRGNNPGMADREKN